MLRTFGNEKTLGHAWNAFKHSQYKTRPLEDALKEAFCVSTPKCDYLFGGGSTVPDSASKVAVVTTTTTGDPVVMGSYNRTPLSEGKELYKFLRPSEKFQEIEVWQAARASSAAPKYFRQYHHQPTDQIYEDGGLFYNNPISIADSERKAIWPERADRPADIMLSIGTGYNPNDYNEKASTDSQSPPPSLGFFSYYRNLKRIAEHHIAMSLNSERAWREWLDTVAHPSDHEDRFVRLNLKCTKDPPKLDDIDAIDGLADSTNLQFAINQTVATIAHHLVASSFYVVATPNLYESNIQCCLTDNEVTVLGQWLNHCPWGGSRPYFVVSTLLASDIPPLKLLLEDKIIDKMTRKGHFSIPFKTEHLLQVEVAIQMWFPDAFSPEVEQYMIGGFPRRLDSVIQPNHRASTDFGTSHLLRGLSYKAQHKAWGASQSSSQVIPSIVDIKDWDPKKTLKHTMSTYLRRRDDEDHLSSFYEQRRRTEETQLYEMPDTSI
ncbi:MAG: hypothetical protein M1814_005429 [Vezdaea aestivalis]|nr:MAG: hypothetical protein M1814_005429 [Vezdaea aestivalis]